MRAETSFNRILAISGAWVASVTFCPEGVVVGLRRRRRRPVCPCGWRGRAVYDHSTRRWRHLDLGATKLWLQAEIRRIHCRRCDRVRTEDVAWARPGARHSRDFEDVVAWLAQRADKTTITKLLRTSWETVAAMVERVVADHLDVGRLEGLYRIGVDEVSDRYVGDPPLRLVTRQGCRITKEGVSVAVVPCLVRSMVGPELVSVSLSHPLLDDYLEFVMARARPNTVLAVAYDLKVFFSAIEREPAEVTTADVLAFIKAQRAPRRGAWNDERLVNPRVKLARGRPAKGTSRGPDRPRWVKHTRWALVKDPDNLTASQLEVLHQLRRSGSSLYRAWQLKEGLRDLYRLKDPADAPMHLDWWLAWACRSRIPAFVTFSKTVRVNRERILAAVELGLSNSKLEGLNSKIRLINHRGYGHHSAAALIAMIYLCCGGITIELPLR